jgi:hypothetical protein
VLNAVTQDEIGKAAGINNMAQRFGAVFAIAIGTAVFSAHGHLGNPDAVTAGFQPALWSAFAFAALATLAAFATGARTPEQPTAPAATDALVAA